MQPLNPTKPRGSRRKKWIFAAGLLLVAVAGLVFIVLYVDWRDGQRQLAWSIREARGPWPKERVAQAVIVSFPRSHDLTGIEREIRDALKKDDVGYFDGTECLRNRCCMFMFGPSAVGILEVARPVLKHGGLGTAAVDLRLGPATARPVVLLREQL